jgi:polysaccharide biosynthesis protein PslG
MLSLRRRWSAPVLVGVLGAVLGLAAAAVARQHATHAAAYLPAPAPSLFGVNTGTYDHDVARLERDTPTAAAIGARWVHFTGGSVSFNAGKPSFAGLDRAVDQAREEHLGVLVSLGGIPAACSLVPRPSDVVHCPPTSAADLVAYDAYLRRMLLHFRGRVQYFESWVEPNHASMWPPSPNAAAYATLLEREYAVVQQVNARYGLHDKLLFAGIGGSDLGYLAAVLDALGGRKAFDIVGDHPYRFAPDDPATPNYAISYPGGGHPRLTWAEELGDYEAEFTSHGYGTPPMWLTEFGWPGANGPDGCGGQTSTEADQASFLRSAYALLTSDPQLSFVKAAFWFNLRDYAPGVANPDPECFAHYGLLNTNFSPKPAGLAFEQLAKEASGG